jgi:hypothetical protein
VHSIGPPHVPEAEHVCTPLPEHWTAPGLQLPEHVASAQASLSQATALPQ